MPVVSADSLLLSAVKEPTPGVIPASPAFNTWRTTGESLTFSPETSDSGELGGTGRTRKPSNVTGMTVSGDINFVLTKFDALEDAMSGVMASGWGECPVSGSNGGYISDGNKITVGKKLDTYSIEKRFPNPAFESGTTVTVSDSGPGAAPAITFVGVASTGTGVAVIDFILDGTQDERVYVYLPIGTDAAAAAAAAVVVLNAVDNVSATDGGGGVVNLATTGSSFTTIESRAGGDEYYYQRFQGASYSAMTLDTAPNADVTGSVSVVGGIPTLDQLPLTGSTYNSAGSAAVFTAPEVMDLTIGTVLGISTHCWQSVSISLDSQNRGIGCVGFQGEKEVVTGLLAASVSGDVYFSDDSVLQIILDNGTAGDGRISTGNADGDVYVFDFFDMKPVSGELSAGGTGEDLTMPLSFEPTPKEVCQDAGGNGWDAGFIISRDNAPLPITGIITASAGVIATNTSTLTIGGGAADKDYTLTITYQVDTSGTDETVDVAIQAWEEITDVIASIQVALPGGGAHALDAVNPTATTVDITIDTATSLDVISVAVA